jgi:hypothetical protein
MISPLLSGLSALGVLSVHVLSRFFLATLPASLPSYSAFPQRLCVMFFFPALLTTTYLALAGPLL